MGRREGTMKEGYHAGEGGYHEGEGGTMKEGVP